MSAPSKVAVSGITGFLGSQIAHDLLARGYTVHGTVRKNIPEKVAHLTKLDLPGTLNIFEADLNLPSSFDEALVDCDYAIHVASPYSFDAANPQKDLVDPAVNGTLSFLASCKKNQVLKVVLTSSTTAIADAGENGKVFDESDWNQMSTLDRLPYFYSKTLAEKAAWKFVDEQAPEIHLVVINPTGVLGPSMITSVNETMGMLTQTVSGQFYGIVDLELTVVDVRDVAEAHIRAMESDTANGRYICAADPLLSHREIVELAVEAGFNPPTRNLTGRYYTSLIKLMSHVIPGGQTGVYTRNNLGNPILFSNARIVRELGMKFRDPKETVKENYEDLIKHGHLTLPTGR